MSRAIALLACVVGCKSGNFLTVDVDGIPCGTSTLEVTVTIDGSPQNGSFANDAAFGDGVTSFSVDLGDHHGGMLDVQVIAKSTAHMLGTATTSVMLPKSALVLDLHGETCTTVDAPSVDLSCWDGIAPTNFAPCTNFPPPVTTNFEISSAMTIDTSTLAGYPADTKLYGLLHVGAFSITQTGQAKVVGTRPLLLVSDSTVTIAGVMTFPASIPSDDCLPVSAPMAGNGGAGGGGAGYATEGAAGGVNALATVDGALGGNTSGEPHLSPMRSGCAGGPGGAGGTLAGGLGGVAPGGIQITAKSSIEVVSSGLVLANGGGGVAGTQDGTNLSGGGGGASGGSILLEANGVTVEGKVCAVGGGGGEGGFLQVVSGSGGGSSDCTVGVGGKKSAGGDGGDGGGDIDPMSGARGGGGGGGAAGRIRIHGIRTGAGMVVPTPSP